MICSEEICEVYEVCRWRNHRMFTDFAYGYSGIVLASFSEEVVKDMEVRICGKYRKAVAVGSRSSKRGRFLRIKGIQPAK